LDVHAYMAERIPLIDAGIAARTGDCVEVPGALTGAMRHLLFPGGKRLRPVLALAAAEAVGGNPRVALPMAVAVELIHTYSLIHDDLPCMDDDATRRGRPTVHVAYGEATAVLAGDALLTEAFAVLAEAGLERGAAEASVRAAAQLARAAGAAGLVGGQVDDLAFSADDPDAAGAASDSPSETERLASIHARKTAALFRASIVGGAVFAGASEAQRAVLDEFGREVGIAFQIADDLLDAESGEAASVLRLQGADTARRGAEELLDRALERLEGWGERAEPLRELARFAVRRSR
jgi:geranylgeranyl diphosphate synthase type II